MKNNKNKVLAIVAIFLFGLSLVVYNISGYRITDGDRYKKYPYFPGSLNKSIAIEEYGLKNIISFSHIANLNLYMVSYRSDSLVNHPEKMAIIDSAGNFVIKRDYLKNNDNTRGNAFLFDVQHKILYELRFATQDHTFDATTAIAISLETFKATTIEVNHIHLKQSYYHFSEQDKYKQKEATEPDSVQEKRKIADYRKANAPVIARLKNAKSMIGDYVVDEAGNLLTIDANTTKERYFGLSFEEESCITLYPPIKSIIETNRINSNPLFDVVDENNQYSGINFNKDLTVPRKENKIYKIDYATTKNTAFGGTSRSLNYKFVQLGISYFELNVKDLKTNFKLGDYSDFPASNFFFQVNNPKDYGDTVLLLRNNPLQLYKCYKK
jgi:hypothetical protein